MESQFTPSPKRGRPPKARDELVETRDLLLRAGLEVLTEKGFSATGIDEILRRVNVPKGSFYHYFDSKEAFGAVLIEQYARFFAHKIDHHLSDQTLSPLSRIRAFVSGAQAGMARHNFRRGCLVGNLGQEMGSLPESFRKQLQAVLADWQSRFMCCLVAAQEVGELSRQADCEHIASFFWIGWEGAVLRAKLEQSAKPLEIFERGFFAGLPPG